MNELLTIRGKGLYVEVHGPEDAPPVLFLHGGPGGNGCLEYMHFQREYLPRDLRVYALDQRGVLRSDALTVDEPFGMEDLIADCEALREHFGIERWSVIGHSFGGHLAVRYAYAYPQSVDCLILEAPALDFALSARATLRAGANEFSLLGDTSSAEEALSYANDLTLSPPAVSQKMSMMNERLGEHCANLYIYGEDKDFNGRMVATSGLPQEQWERNNLHTHRLFEEGYIYDSLFPLLPELYHPTLLIRGIIDPVCDDEQAELIAQGIPHLIQVVFEQSGHCPNVEEREHYADLVTFFIQMNGRTTTKNSSPVPS